MTKSFTLFASIVLCLFLLPTLVFGQEGRSQVIHPDHFDKTDRPLREMFDRPGKPDQILDRIRALLR